MAQYKEKYSNNMKAYAALYCPDIHESAYATLSVHLSKEGAEKAISFHKMEEINKWNKESEGIFPLCNIEEYKAWDIEEIEIHP